jgi:hypothetical protein
VLLYLRETARGILDQQGQTVECSAAMPFAPFVDSVVTATNSPPQLVRPPAPTSNSPPLSFRPEAVYGVLAGSAEMSRLDKIPFQQGRLTAAEVAERSAAATKLGLWSIQQVRVLG